MMMKIGAWALKQKKPLIIGSGLAIVFIAAVCIGIGAGIKNGEEETVYREALVEKGELTVGITKDGTVETGTTQQTFRLDISAYTDSESTASSLGDASSIFQGMGMIGQTSAQSGSDSSRQLIVEQVLVTQGQEVAEGNPVLTITGESIDKIRSELEEDTQDAKNSHAKASTLNQLSQLEATQNYRKNTAYGGLAENEYMMAVANLNEAVAEIEEEIADTSEELEKLRVNLAEYQTDLEENQEVLVNAEYVVSVASDPSTDPYGWTTAENARESVAQTVEDLEDTIKETQDSIAEKEKELENLEQQLAGAQMDLELGTIEAQANYELRNLKSKNAQALYDVEAGLSELDVTIAQEEYEEASAKLAEFDAYLADRQILSEYSGVITEISVSEGDSVGTKDVLFVLNDYDDVTVNVSVKEEELESIAEGDSVQVSVASYPDGNFSGSVTEIGEGSYNSSTGAVNYDVTIKLAGDTSVLFQGMSTQITFITKQTQTVTYVSNRAVIRENGTSYVKKKGEDGTIVKQEIVTGFSDGTNVEIKEGLTEGDTVLISATGAARADGGKK